MATEVILPLNLHGRGRDGAEDGKLEDFFAAMFARETAPPEQQVAQPFAAYEIKPRGPPKVACECVSYLDEPDTLYI